jgi:hypothetical protein
LRLVLTVVGVALFGLAAETASSARKPSERGCLLAWNTPENAANRHRIVSEGPWSASLLLPGVAGTVTWQRGSAPAATTAAACGLTLMRRSHLLPVTGIWRNGRVARWSFGRLIATEDGPRDSNVRVLTDGRVTKIYRR